MKAHAEAQQNFIILSPEELDSLIKKTVRVALKEQQRIKADEAAALQDHRLRNTSVLLRNYRLLHKNAENAVTDLKQLENEESIKELMAMMNNKETAESFKVQAIQKSTAKTIVMIKHIDRMLELYRSHCQNSKDDQSMRRYEITMDRYVRGEAECSIEELSEKYYVGAATVYRDLRIAKEELSALIFGADGIRQAATH